MEKLIRRFRGHDPDDWAEILHGPINTLLTKIAGRENTATTYKKLVKFSSNNAAIRTITQQ